MSMTCVLTNAYHIHVCMYIICVQILTAMDGLDTSNNGVIVMAATNRAELLDPALLRAGMIYDYYTHT